MVEFINLTGSHLTKRFKKEIRTHTQYKHITETVVNMSIVARIKLRSKLKNTASEIGYYSYTNRQTAQQL